MKIGIIGCGNIALAHIRALSLNINVSEFVLFDSDEEKIYNITNCSHASFYIAKDLRDLASNSDCFIVCTPNNSHKNVIEEILKIKRMPFLCEKPLASTYEDANIICNIATKNSIISFNYRFNYSFHCIKQYLKDNALGECLFFDAEYNKNSALIRKEITWRDCLEQNNSSGALGDLSCHLLDYFCWLTHDTININNLSSTKGTRVKFKQGKLVNVDDNGCIFGTNFKGTFFKIKVSKSELDKQKLGVHLILIYKNLELNYTTHMPDEFIVKFTDSMDIQTIKINREKQIPDTEREIPFWADSFIWMDNDWINSILDNKNEQCPSLKDGLHIQKILNKILSDECVIYPYLATFCFRIFLFSLSFCMILMSC